MPRFVDDWRSAWKNPVFRGQFLLSVAGSIVVALLFRVFLDYIERRAGVILHDPVLQLFRPVDLHWITISVVYSGLLLGLISLLLHPFALNLALRAATALALLRIVCLWFLPLEPALGNIPLIDPLISWPVAGQTLTRDLFFGGYTSVMALFAFIAQWKDMKIIFACFAAAVSLLMLLQHIHYTIDVLAAPCFAYAALGIARQFTVVEIVTPVAR
jgi:hypothetical protein